MRRRPWRAALPAMLVAFGATGEARVPGHTVAAETAATAAAAELTFLDSEYKQQMQGGTHQ